MKAAQARHLLKVLHHICQNRAPLETPQQMHRLELLKQTETFYEIIEQQPMYMTRAASDACLTATISALLEYTWLARDAINRNMYLWNVVPKFHYWYHVAQQCRFFNPSYGWTFRDEDLMGRIARIGHSCIFGAGGLRMGETLFLKYLLGIFVRFKRRARLGVTA